jgi:hypothetical protein
MRKIKTITGDDNFTAEIKALSIKNNLMILGLDIDTQELLWNHAPEWDFLEDNIDRFTLYHVAEPALLKEKRFAPLPVNSRLPYSFCDIQHTVSVELQVDLAQLKESLMAEEFTW